MALLFNAAAPLGSLFDPMAAGIAFSIGLGLNGVWLIIGVLMAATAAFAVRLPRPAGWTRITPGVGRE